MLTWGDIVSYVRLFLRWWFVLVLSVVLSAGTALYITRGQADMFSSQATVSVGNNFEVAAPTQAQVSLSNVLADYYAALTKREVILGPVVESLQLNFPWWLIRDVMLTTRVDRGANLLEIKVSDTDPERAAAIANAIANQLIAYTPNAPEKVAAQQAEISRQLEESQRNIQAVEAKITELENRLSGLSSAIDISDVQSQLDALQTTRQRYLGEYANLLDLSNQTSANSLSIFEAARPAEAPLPKKLALTLAMAGGGGLLMAILAVLVLDRLDERWRTGRDLQSRTGIKSLGDVPPTPSGRPGARFAPAARQKAVNDAYSNMVLAAKSKLPRALLISSPQVSEARSTLAVDLAEMYTRTGHRVLLVSTEPEHASVVERLGHVPYTVAAADRDQGFADAIGSLRSFVRPTKIHNLLVLSGQSAGHEYFSSLVPLVYWPEMLTHLRKSADVVIFDGPAALSGPDAGLLAPLVDASMLVLNGRQDTRSIAIKACQQLTSDPNTQFLGAIVTSVERRRAQKPALAEPKGSGFQIAVGRSGITITFGNKKPLPVPDTGTVGSGPRLLGLPELHVKADSAASASGAGDSASSPGDAAHVTWEDLLDLEMGAPAGEAQRVSDAERSGQRYGWAEAARINADPPGGAPLRAIITPPPTEGGPLSGGAAGAPPSAMRPGQQRRARIANSRRVPRQSPPQPDADGA